VNREHLSFACSGQPTCHLTGPGPRRNGAAQGTCSTRTPQRQHQTGERWPSSQSAAPRGRGCLRCGGIPPEPPAYEPAALPQRSQRCPSRSAQAVTTAGRHLHPGHPVGVDSRLLSDQGLHVPRPGASSLQRGCRNRRLPVVPDALLLSGPYATGRFLGEEPELSVNQTWRLCLPSSRGRIIQTSTDSRGEEEAGWQPQKSLRGPVIVHWDFHQGQSRSPMIAMAIAIVASARSTGSFDLYLAGEAEWTWLGGRIQS
jgi:hypothetical protein